MLSPVVEFLRQELASLGFLFYWWRGSWVVATGQLQSLSEQQLVDCSKQNCGFNGGLRDYAYDYYKTFNIGFRASAGSRRILVVPWLVPKEFELWQAPQGDSVLKELWSRIDFERLSAASMFCIESQVASSACFESDGAASLAKCLRCVFIGSHEIACPVLNGHCFLHCPWGGVRISTHAIAFCSR